MQEFTGIEYIKIDIANQYGLDKLDWDSRIDWTNTHRTELQTMSAEASKPILFRKAVRALEAAESKQPTGFLMSMDATASGLQIMAALTQCVTTGASVNLVNTGKREDLYGRIATFMSQKVGKGIERDVLKYPIMTVFYGSRAKPIEIFGKDTPEIKAFYELLHTLLPGAMEAMELIQSCWRGDALAHTWTLPDKHVAKVKVMVPMDKKVEIDELDHASFTHRVYINQAEEQGISLAANVIHSIDGYVVREMTRRAHEQGFELLCIHDSFWSSPNYMNNVRKNYAEILAEIAESNLLGDILNEISDKEIIMRTRSSNALASQIAKSEYALS